MSDAALPLMLALLSVLMLVLLRRLPAAATNTENLRARNCR
jgi:hypothetical protein